MNKKIVKSVVGLTASIGVSTVVGNVAKATMPVDASKFGRIATIIGTVVISGMAGIAAEKYTDDQVEKVISIFTNDPA